MNRLENLPTLRIRPARRRPFLYRGGTYYGVEGDTVATALYANRIRVYSRSPKYRRPRGLYSLDGECSNAMMSVNGVPNVNTEKTLLEKGMKIVEQNVRGSAENDWLGFMDRFDRMMPAGFYYRTMHKPAKIWPAAMKAIRLAAGRGKISPDFEMPGAFDEIYPACEVCVIGGGPSGMSAALAAAEKGLRVILLEARPFLGGFFDYRTAAYDGKKRLYERSAELAEQIEGNENIRLFKHASVVGTYNNNLITAFQIGTENDCFDQRYVEIRAGSVVVATGCTERPLIFENNERPGVMQVNTAHRLAHTYGLLPGRKALFSIGHDLGWEAAIDLHDLGLKIVAILDCREDGQNERLVKEAKRRGIRIVKGWVVTEAHGGKRVEKATIGTTDGTVTKEVDCDIIVASAGFTPATGPLSINQAKLQYDPYTNFFLPTDLPAKTHAAGRVLGLADAHSIEISGRLAGLKAALESGISCASEIKKVQNRLDRLPGPERGAKLLMAPVAGRKSFICFDEDVSVKNIKQALEQGFDLPELIKRFTAAGLGPGQGGIPGHNLPLFVAKYQAKGNETIRPTNQRAPLLPTLIAAYAGYRRDMVKRTPIHDLQERDGAVFRRFGVWFRARYFSQDFSCKEEILNVRNNVGLLDASTLGKFRIHGPDALKALQRVYIGDISKLRKGRVKYSAMCNEDGCVLDDGIVVKNGENDYYFTTSTGRAGSTVEWIRFHTRFENWNFALVNLTDAMGVVNLSGPNARKVLEKATDFDVSDGNFGFSRYCEFKVKETIPVKAMRLGFVGELSYELHVPSSYMSALWKILKEEGAEFGISNFGVEAQNVLRMEKCHIILGQESEQRTNLLDVGLGFLWARKQTAENKVGAAALRHAEFDQSRFRLVGIRMEDPDRPAKDGSIIVDERIRGYVCTMRKSFSLKESIGLALVERELGEPGTQLEIFEDECQGDTLPATVVPTPFYDTEGQRMKM